MAGSAFKLGKIAYTKQDITSAGGTTVLLNNSDRYQYVTGSTSQTIQLPDATTMVVALGFKVINGNTAGSVVVTNNGGTTLATLSPGQSAEFVVDSISTANGVWMVLQGGSGTAGFTVTENSQTGTSYTLVLSDGSAASGVSLVSLNNANSVTVTVPTNASVAFPIGTEINFIQKGAGQVTISPAGGVTINSANGYTNLGGQYAEATIIKTSTNSWYLFGTISNNFIQATGGTISFNGNQKSHTFNSSGTFQITSGSGTVSSLVVAGGGGGAGNSAAGAPPGGGGAGGLIYTYPGAVLGVGSYTVTVGSGGAGASGNANGTSGNNSQFNGMTAAVGGGGGTTTTGSSGGSGGGGGSAGGAATAGQGNAGGSGVTGTRDCGGGGGGSGSAGSNAVTNVAGNGGTGTSNSITGSAVFYASGGGGGVSGGGGGTPGSASAGGGGAGAIDSGTGTAGTANTGGGGGAGGLGGGAGGSGVVIVSYQYQ